MKQSLVINHGTDTCKIADVLAREKIPVLLGPVTTIGGEEIPDNSYQKEMWEEMKRSQDSTNPKY